MSRIVVVLTAVVLATAAPVLAVTVIPPVAGPHAVPVDMATTDAARSSSAPAYRSAGRSAEEGEIAAALAGLLIVSIVFAASRPPRSFSD